MNASVQILLKSVLVIENGTADAGVEGVNALTATLLAPNTTKASVTTARSIKLTDKHELDMAEVDFEDKFLFKEDILGDCMLKIELTAVEKVSKLEKFFLKAFPSLLGIAIKAIPGIGTIFSSVASAVITPIFDGINTNDRITIIGKGSMPLSAANEQGDLVLNLSVPEKVVLNSTPFFNEEGDEFVRRITLNKGFVNAKVVVSVIDINPGRAPFAGGIVA